MFICYTPVIVLLLFVLCSYVIFVCVLLEMRVIYKGCSLEDSRILHDYMIKDSSTLHVLLRLRGEGMMSYDVFIAQF